MKTMPIKAPITFAAAGAALGLLLVLSACGGRDEPGGTFFDPVCMPDGSVVYNQQPYSGDQYGPPQGKKENCPWYKQPK